jgi:hypothetical protein
MNLGIYINNLGNHDQLGYIAKEINRGLASKEIDDASIFYDGVAHNPYQVNCGTFNSTDLWNFHGALVVSNIGNALMAISIVNNIDIYYYYNWEEGKNTIDIINLLNKGISVICRNEADAENIFRITGKKPIGICENFQNIIHIISENSNGRFKNCANVCRSS